MIKGIDVSHWQGEIDWDKVPKDIRFVIVASGDGQYLDPNYEKNIQGAVRTGRATTAYHYLRRNVPPDIMATICKERHSIASKWGAGEYFWGDWEDGFNSLMSPIDSWDWAAEFRVLCLRANIPLGHYTRASWWSPNMGAGNGFPDDPLWVAHWTDDPTRVPAIPRPWQQWAVWQYGGGIIPGIGGTVDLNIAWEGVFGGVALTEEQEWKDFTEALEVEIDYLDDLQRAVLETELLKAHLVASWRRGSSYEPLDWKFYREKLGPVCSRIQTALDALKTRARH